MNDERPVRVGKMNENKHKGLFAIHPVGIVMKTNPAEKPIVQRQVFMDISHLFAVISLAKHALYYIKHKPRKKLIFFPFTSPLKHLSRTNSQPVHTRLQKNTSKRGVFSHTSSGRVGLFNVVSLTLVQKPRKRLFGEFKLKENYICMNHSFVIF